MPICKQRMTGVRQFPMEDLCIGVIILQQEIWIGVRLLPRYGWYCLELANFQWKNESNWNYTIPTKNMDDE